MRNVFLYFMILFFLFSCNEKKNGSDLICGGNKKYWNRVHKDELYPGYGAVFLEDGRIINYYYKYRENDRIHHANSLCVMSSDNWKYISDTTMMMNNAEFRILTLTDEVLIVQLKESEPGDKVIFLKSEDQTSEVVMEYGK